MAEEITKAAATPEATSVRSPAAAAGATASPSAAPGAGTAPSLAQFLAESGIGTGGMPAPIIPGDATDDPDTTTATTDPDQSTQSTKTTPSTETDPEAAEDTATAPAGTTPKTKPEPKTPPQSTADEDEDGQVGEDGRIILGANEAAIIKQMEADRRPKHEIGRVRDAFKREIKRRFLLKAADAEKSALQQQITDLNASLTETAEKATALPGSPLARFTDKDELLARKKEGLEYLTWAESHPDEAMKDWKDDDTATAYEHFSANKSKWLNFIAQADEQIRVITAGETSRQAVKAAAPNLFDPKHPDGMFRLELRKGDPRLRPDYDQILADAAHGRKLREEKAKGFQHISLPPSEKKGAKTNGATHGANGHEDKNGNGKEINGSGPAATKSEAKDKEKEAYTLPPPRGRLPVTPAGANRLQDVMERSKTGAVSMDEILDAQAGN